MYINAKIAELASKHIIESLISSLDIFSAYEYILSNKENIA